MAWNAQLLLARVTGDEKAAAATRDFLDGWRLGRVVNVTRGGLAYADDWGTLRNSANRWVEGRRRGEGAGRGGGCRPRPRLHPSSPAPCSPSSMPSTWAGRRGRRTSVGRWGSCGARAGRGGRGARASARAPFQPRHLPSPLRSYMLGDAPGGQSFVVGQGARWPRQPHQRAASCPSPPATCNYLQARGRGVRAGAGRPSTAANPLRQPQPTPPRSPAPLARPPPAHPRRRPRRRLDPRRGAARPQPATG